MTSRRGESDRLDHQAQQLVHDGCAEERSVAGRIERGGNFDDIGADNVEPAQPANEGEGLSARETSSSGVPVPGANVGSTPSISKVT